MLIVTVEWLRGPYRIRTKELNSGDLKNCSELRRHMADVFAAATG
ncbi:hypothetical protein E9229_000942 [Paeniglutamicibacter cryotolerans]|uniref:Uncharacterized protein n=1 Tax=Paeniglutamicibacter cryotolerans TaxID=670079 RepID=A0A839QRR4_9MICC|nr:hypothetical protein [Paeniglutamicibacter cryotolerans]